MTLSKEKNCSELILTYMFLLMPFVAYFYIIVAQHIDFFPSFQTRWQFSIYIRHIGVNYKFRVVFDRFIKEYLHFVFHAKSYLLGIMDAVKCQYDPCKYFYILNLKK